MELAKIQLDCGKCSERFDFEYSGALPFAIYCPACGAQVAVPLSSSKIKRPPRNSVQNLASKATDDFIASFQDIFSDGAADELEATSPDDTLGPLARRRQSYSPGPSSEFSNRAKTLVSAPGPMDQDSTPTPRYQPDPNPNEPRVTPQSDPNKITNYGLPSQAKWEKQASSSPLHTMPGLDDFFADAVITEEKGQQKNLLGFRSPQQGVADGVGVMRKPKKRHTNKKRQTIPGTHVNSLIKSVQHQQSTTRRGSRAPNTTRSENRLNKPTSPALPIVNKVMGMRSTNLIPEDFDPKPRNISAKRKTFSQSAPSARTKAQHSQKDRPLSRRVVESAWATLQEVASEKLDPIPDINTLTDSRPEQLDEDQDDTFVETSDSEAAVLQESNSVDTLVVENANGLDELITASELESFADDFDMEEEAARASAIEKAELKKQQKQQAQERATQAEIVDLNEATELIDLVASDDQHANAAIEQDKDKPHKESPQATSKEQNQSPTHKGDSSALQKHIGPEDGPQELGELPKFVDAPPSPKAKSKAPIFVALLIALVLILAALVLFQPWRKSNQSDAEPAAAPVEQVQPGRAEIHQALRFANARAAVAYAASETILRGELIRRAQEFENKGKREEALKLYEWSLAQGMDDPAAISRYGALLIEEERFGEAQELLWRARDLYPRDAILKQLLERSFDDDPRFLPEVHTLTSRDLDAIKYLGGGSTITLRFIDKGKPVAAFKPHQKRRQSNYRSEIAAWRLCQLLRCSFKVPYNRPVRLSEAHFYKLYNRIDSANQRAYAKNFEDLVWRRGYLFGTEKEWIPSFTQFPIEVTSVWTPWLSQSEDLFDFDPMLERSLAEWRKDPVTEKAYQRVLSQTEGLTTQELAHQLSDLLVFDYLSGNWDRFSGVKAWWGTNCQYGNNQLISIDNGAAFPALAHAGRVTNRFKKAERFSRTLVRELRLLDHDATLNKLFPEPSSHEQKAFELFWKKRAAVLARIDALIEIHGEDAVLAFE